MTDKRNDCNFSNNIMTNGNNYYSYILYYIIVIYNISKMTDEKSATVLRKKNDVLTAKTMSVINISQLLPYYLILIALGWVTPVTSSTSPFPTDLENLPCDVTVFQNDTAEFQYYSTSKPVSVRINGTKIHDLDEALQHNLEFDSSREPNYTLLFKQTNLEYNNTIVGFRDKTGEIRNASLFIQDRPTEEDENDHDTNLPSNRPTEEDENDHDTNLPSNPSTEEDENEHDTNLPWNVIGGAVAGLVVIACISVAGIVGIWCCSSKTTNKSSGKSDTEDNNCRNQTEQVSQTAILETADSINRRSLSQEIVTGSRPSLGRRSPSVPANHRNTSDVHADENRNSTNPQHQPIVFSDEGDAPMHPNVIEGLEEGINMYPLPIAEQSQGTSTTMV